MAFADILRLDFKNMLSSSLLIDYLKNFKQQSDHHDDDISVTA